MLFRNSVCYYSKMIKNKALLNSNGKPLQATTTKNKAKNNRVVKRHLRMGNTASIFSNLPLSIALHQIKENDSEIIFLVYSFQEIWLKTKTPTWWPFFLLLMGNTVSTDFYLPLSIALYQIKENGTRITSQAYFLQKIWLKTSYFATILDFTGKLDVVFTKEANRNSDQLTILQRVLVPNFKFLCYLVRPTDSFQINKGYIAKNSKKVKKKDNFIKIKLKKHKLSNSCKKKKSVS